MQPLTSMPVFLRFMAVLSAFLTGQLSAQQQVNGIKDLQQAAINASAESIHFSETSTWTLDFSGHARTMQETYRGYEFGLGDISREAWIHQRLQGMLTLEDHQRWLISAELSSGHLWGKESSLAPPDQDDLDFLQLFVRRQLNLTKEDILMIQAGRQTLYYGSGRLLAAREGANQRLSHDALLLSWQRRDEIFRMDSFIASPVLTRPGVFDNQSYPDELLFWGIYAVMPSPWQKESSFDLYYIGLHDKASIFTSPGENENRQTLGFRWWDETKPWIRNTELILQFGKAGDRDILAGAASLGIGYVYENLPMQPALMLRADAISGGDDKGALHTFHPLFQANNYFNEGGFISPSNLYNINPVISLQPHSKVTVNLGVNFQWRFSSLDSVYAPPLQQLGPPSPEAGRYLGTAFNVSFTLSLSRQMEFTTAYTHHEAGNSLSSIGGSSVDYFQATLRFSF